MMKTTFDGYLDVTIADARLSTSQRRSKQDPYCAVTLGSGGLKNLMEGESFGKERFQTKVHNGGGQHPAWDETHSLSLKNMKLDSYLKVKLYDKDTIKDDFLGEAKITLQELLRWDRGEVGYFPIYNSSQVIGQIGVAVTFNCTEIPRADIKRQETTQQSGFGQSQYQQSGTNHQYRLNQSNMQPTNLIPKGQVEQGHPVPHNVETSGDLVSKGQIEQGHPLPRNIGQKIQYGSIDMVSKGQMEQGHPLPHNIGTSDDIVENQRGRAL